MPQVLIQFRATEHRDCYVCTNVTMYNNDVVALDRDTQRKEISHFLLREKDSENFKEVHDMEPTVTWEELPPEANAVRFIEEFKRRFRADIGFREHALSLGCRVELRS